MLQKWRDFQRGNMTFLDVIFTSPLVGEVGAKHRMRGAFNIIRF
jgi:hypothetical protein